MDEELAKQFLEELRAAGGDLGEWIDRKGQENASFTGLELDPEKLKRMAKIQALCKSLKKLDKYIDYKLFPLGTGNRHGSIQLIVPYANFWSDNRILNTLAELFALSDHVHLVAPGLFPEDDDDEYDDNYEYDDEEEELEQYKDKILITFHVADMWKVYGKAPF